MNKHIPTLLGLLLLILAVWLQITPIDLIRSFITRLDNLAYDIQLRTRILTVYDPPTSPVAIIDIDDKSLLAEGRWPWSRDKLASLVNRLKEEGAVVIAIDMIFPEPEINITEDITRTLKQKKLNSPQISDLLSQISPEFNNDAKLASSLRDQDSVLGITFLFNKEQVGLLPPPLLTLQTPTEKSLDFITAQGYVSNIPILQNAAKTAGFINVYPDADGIIRRVPLVIRYNNHLYPSLALQAAKLFSLQEVSLVAGSYHSAVQLESIKLGKYTIPVNASGEALISFRGKSFTFPYYSATDLLKKKTPQNAFSGKIVLIGTSAIGLGDLRATSVQGVFPGVEIQANLIDSILTDNFSYKPEWTAGAEIFITIVLGLICAFSFPYLGPKTLGPIIIIFPILLVVANNYLWEQTGLILFIFIPIALTIFLALFNMTYGYLFETRRRENLKQMFGQYVPAEHIDEMLLAKGNYALYGEDRDLTVLFADIRNFTTLSEPLTATELKELLNEFFTPMTEAIFKYKGTIDKYIGDLIMAFWGAPLKDRRHAEHAISAALDMQQAVSQLTPAFIKRGWGAIEIGIGINTGIMSVGDMGSKFRRNYTVLGDAVNLGSRIEGLTKFYGAKIIVSEYTQKDQKKFLFRKLDRVQVKGRKNGVEIYEVIARLAEASEETKHEIDLSNKAIEFYFERKWQEAHHLFSELLKAHPDTKFYMIFLARIEEFQASPPPIDWDGIFVHTEK